MKKVFTLIVAVLLTNICLAQKIISGSLEHLYDQDTLNIQFDYSKTLIDGIKESSLVNIGGKRASEWVKAKDELNYMFIIEMLNEVGGIIELGHYPNSKYTLIVSPKTFDNDGEMHGTAEIIDTEGNIIVSC